MQTIKTPGGETLVVMSLDEYEDMQDSFEYEKAMAAIRPDDEFLTLEEALAFAEAATPLRFWRNKRGMTQAQLAEKAGMAESDVVNFEGGVGSDELVLLKKLAVALNVRMEKLVAD